MHLVNIAWMLDGWEGNMEDSVIYMVDNKIMMYGGWYQLNKWKEK